MVGPKTSLDCCIVVMNHFFVMYRMVKLNWAAFQSDCGEMLLHVVKNHLKKFVFQVNKEKMGAFWCWLTLCVCVCEYVCVCERERNCVCARKRERESKCVRVCEFGCLYFQKLFKCAYFYACVMFVPLSRIFFVLHFLSFCFYSLKCNNC